jgi:5'-nucleotidase
VQPLVLICNDDGVFSPGLKAAAEAVDSLGELLIAAPATQQTGMGRCYPQTEDVGIIDTVYLDINGRQHIAYGIHGTPSQAVAHGVLELAPRKPSLCVSGINYGENVGLTVISSGTVGAAFEADTFDIPALAISQEVRLELVRVAEYDKLSWDAAIHFTRYFADRVLREGLPKSTAVLNINIPSGATIHTPIRLTTQSRQKYVVIQKPDPRDFSKSYPLKVKVEIDKDDLERSSDIQALVYDRVVSVTPLLWDLTAQSDWGREFIGKQE